MYHRLIQAFETGDLLQAQQLQQQSIDMIRLLGKYGGIATGKAYMQLVGLDCGTFRLPVKNMDAAAFAQFQKDVANLSFSNYCSTKPALAK